MGCASPFCDASREPIPSPRAEKARYCVPSPRGLRMTHIAAEAGGIRLEERSAGQRSPPPRRGRVGWGCASAGPSGPASPPHPPLPPPRGEGVLPTPVSRQGGGRMRVVLSPAGEGAETKVVQSCTHHTYPRQLSHGERGRKSNHGTTAQNSDAHCLGICESFQP
jgi:hypothetical protein